MGLGTGETAGWLARVEGMEQVDVVELEYIEAVRGCVGLDFNVDEPRVQPRRRARTSLLTAAERFDVIVNEPSNPYRAGIASLFTVEFYEAVQDKLTDEGLFVQWLQAYDLSPRTVRTVLATLGTVFPHVEIFESQTAGDLLLVASNNPVDHDLARIAERTGQHPYQEALSWTWGVSGVEGLYSAYVANQGLARAVVEAEETASTPTTIPSSSTVAKTPRHHVLGLRPARPVLRPGESRPLDCLRTHWTGSLPRSFVMFGLSQSRPAPACPRVSAAAGRARPRPAAPGPTVSWGLPRQPGRQTASRWRLWTSSCLPMRLRAWVCRKPTSPWPDSARAGPPPRLRS